MLQPRRQNVFSAGELPKMTTEYIQSCYKNIRKEMKKCEDGNKFWIEKNDSSWAWLVRSDKLSFDKTATTLKSTALRTILFKWKE